MTPANAGEYCALENNNGRGHNLAEYIISEFERYNRINKKRIAFHIFKSRF